MEFGLNPSKTFSGRVPQTIWKSLQGMSPVFWRVDATDHNVVWVAQVDDSEQEKPRRRLASRVHQVAVHDDAVVGGESSRTLETVRHLRLGGAAGRVASRVVAAAARHSQITVRRTEGKITTEHCVKKQSKN